MKTVNVERWYKRRIVNMQKRDITSNKSTFAIKSWITPQRCDTIAVLLFMRITQFAVSSFPLSCTNNQTSARLSGKQVRALEGIQLQKQGNVMGYNKKARLE